MFISLDEKKLTDDTFKVFSDYIESICREIEMREDETMQKILDRIQTPSFAELWIMPEFRGNRQVQRVLFVVSILFSGFYLFFLVSISFSGFNL